MLRSLKASLVRILFLVFLKAKRFEKLVFICKVKYNVSVFFMFCFLIQILCCLVIQMRLLLCLLCCFNRADIAVEDKKLKIPFLKSNFIRTFSTLNANTCCYFARCQAS